jgi:hypothetical protein
MDKRLGTADEVQLARDMYHAWVSGTTKSEIELRFLGTTRAHGKRFSTIVRNNLGIETEKTHPLTVENNRLRALLRQHGIDPDEGA